MNEIEKILEEHYENKETKDPVLALAKLDKILLGDSHYIKGKGNVKEELEIAENKRIIQTIRNLIKPVREQIVQCYLEAAAGAKGKEALGVKGLAKVGKLTAPKRAAAILGTAAAEFGYLLARYSDSYGSTPLWFNSESNSALDIALSSADKAKKKNFITFLKISGKDKYIERVCVEAYAIIGRAINNNTPTLNIYEALCKQISAANQKISEQLVYQFFQHFSGLDKGKKSNHFRHTLEALSYAKLLYMPEEFRMHLHLLYDVEHPTMKHVMQAMLLLLTGDEKDLIPGVSKEEVKLMLNYVGKYQQETSELLKNNTAAENLIKIIDLARQPKNEENAAEVAEIIDQIIRSLPKPLEGFGSYNISLIPSRAQKDSTEKKLVQESMPEGLFKPADHKRGKRVVQKTLTEVLANDSKLSKVFSDMEHQLNKGKMLLAEDWIWLQAQKKALIECRKTEPLAEKDKQQINQLLGASEFLLSVGKNVENKLLFNPTP